MTNPDPELSVFLQELNPVVDSYLTASPDADAESIRTNLAFLRLFRNWTSNDSSLNDTPPRGQWTLLRTIFFSKEQRMSVVELARSMEVSSTYVTKLVDALEVKGYLERQVNTQDRRMTYAALTDAGREVSLREIPIAIGNMEAHFEGFSEDEKRALQLLLSKLYNNIVRLNNRD